MSTRRTYNGYLGAYLRTLVAEDNPEHLASIVTLDRPTPKMDDERRAVMSMK